jgi:multiple sugar transport system substrate-binding protein
MTSRVELWRSAGLASAIAALAATATTAMAQTFYAEAAKPYAGRTIRVLDEITPLQETLSKIVPDFTKETGIKVEWELLNHFEVISKGQADMVSGRGYYDAVMLHGFQMGPMLAAGVIRPIDDLVKNPKLSNPALGEDDFIQGAYRSTSFYKGKQYGFSNWNYNQIYWARADLLNDSGEQAAFKAKYGYDLAPAKTIEQIRDIAEFFTRKKGATLAGKPLDSDFYGIILEGIKGGSTFLSLWGNFIKNYGGDIMDANGRPTFDRPENVAAIKMWASLWKFSPPGTAEASLVDVPTIMGNGIAAQTIAWSDFVLGIDKPGKSAYAGKFVYGAIPVQAGYQGPRGVEAEISVTVISAASKNPEPTFLFLQWLAERKQQEKLITEGQGGVPIRTSSWAMPVLTQGPLTGLFSAMKASLDVSIGKPKMPKFYEVYDELTGLAQEIGLGKVTPEDGAKRGQQIMVKHCGQNCLL